jgi:enoyl-CoA hydratase/carnithine racemase
MWRAIPALVRQAEADIAVRAIAVTGSGDRAFSAGADISQFGEQRTAGEAAEAYEVAVADANAALAGAAKPTVALIRGICFGGGLALAMCCDMRLARADARFRIPAARLGLGYAFGNVRALVRRIGIDAAGELLFTAQIFDAAGALRLGVATRVLPADSFEADSEAFLAGLAENAPLTLMAVKRALIELSRPEAEQDGAAVDALVARCFASADYIEGQAAFAEKRTPRFRGA